MQSAFAEQVAAQAKAHRAEIQKLVEECHATTFLGERFRNHGERPNGVTFMGRGTRKRTHKREPTKEKGAIIDLRPAVDI